MAADKRIVLVQPNEYFQAAVSGAVSTLKVDVSEHAQVYLVQLLAKFINTENVYPIDADGNRAETLTQQLAAALEQDRAEDKARKLKQLGDFSLYISGFFAGSFSRKLVDVDYYIGMGGAAYGTVAQLEEKKSRAQLFAELAKKFPAFVDILGQISEETGFNPEDHKDLLRTYDLWVKTGSERLAKQLAKAGIVPSQAPLKKVSGDDS